MSGRAGTGRAAPRENPHSDRHRRDPAGAGRGLLGRAACFSAPSCSGWRWWRCRSTSRCARSRAPWRTAFSPALSWFSRRFPPTARPRPPRRPCRVSRCFRSGASRNPPAGSGASPKGSSGWPTSAMRWGCLWLLRTRQAHGAAWVFLVLVATWAGDSAAYFIGSRFGRRKFAPTLSPNKTWAGAFGGLAGSLCGALIAYPAFGGAVASRWSRPPPWQSAWPGSSAISSSRSGSGPRA